jgi:hypothetical protein
LPWSTCAMMQKLRMWSRDTGEAESKGESRKGSMITSRAGSRIESSGTGVEG